MGAPHAGAERWEEAGMRSRYAQQHINRAKAHDAGVGWKATEEDRRHAGKGDRPRSYGAAYERGFAGIDWRVKVGCGNCGWRGKRKRSRMGTCPRCGAMVEEVSSGR